MFSLCVPSSGILCEMQSGLDAVEQGLYFEA